MATPSQSSASPFDIDLFALVQGRATYGAETRVIVNIKHSEILDSRLGLPTFH